MKEKIKVLITEEEINNRIKEIACDINRDYYGEDVVLVCVLNGAVYFAVDLHEVFMTTKLQGKDTFFLPFKVSVK